MILYIYGVGIYINTIEKERLDEKFTEVSKTIHSEVKTLINEKSEAILLLSLALSESDRIKGLLLSDKRMDLDLVSFSKKLKKHSSLHNVWFQILSDDGTSIYRSWTKKHGDNVVSIRSDIARVLKQHQILSSISVGKFDMTFKSIVPIFDKHRFIGMIETIAKFNSISRKAQHLGWNNLLLVDEKYKKQLKHVDAKKFLKGYYVANSNNADTSLIMLVQNDIEDYIKPMIYTLKGGFLLTNYIIKDIDGNYMASFILAKDVHTIDTAEIINQKRMLISIAFIIYIAVASLLYYIYVFNYKRFVKKQHQLLQENVASKTKEIEIKSQTLKYQAEHDTLTGLPNRFLFLDRLKQALRYAHRSNERVSVLFLDLDRFKEINDTYGHEVGDKLLKLVTKRLLEGRREEDTVARLGGDEFTLILKNLEHEDIVLVVNKIIKNMQKPFSISGNKHYTTFSIGISSYPEDGKTDATLLRNADTAMYKAKENGKNNYHFYNIEMTQKMLERISLEKELRSALENKEFEAYFQPKIDAKHMRVIGLEALIRWKHPTKGIVFPDKFIPFAEEIGLIGEIDNYMMYLSLRQVLQWQKKGIECGKISINLSTRQLASKNYLQELKDAIETIKLDTKFIEIEITETHIMENPQHAMDILHKIRDLGISIAIDDFGTGYSSLSYLKKLPLTKLKIDRTFMMELPVDKDDVIIVKTIISLAKNLGLEIIAEGVEKKAQVDFLLAQGCDYIQGYYFCKPLPKDECETFLIDF